MRRFLALLLAAALTAGGYWSALQARSESRIEGKALAFALSFMLVLVAIFAVAFVVWLLLLTFAWLLAPPKPRGTDDDLLADYRKGRK